MRQGAAIAGPELETQIDHRRWRQRQLPDALRQRERRDFAFTRRLVRDDAGCRASQHDGGSGDATELERGVDRVIARVALLLVRRLLLLVDDDQTEALERREERGARADDHVGDSVEDPPPLVETLACRKGAVQKRDAIAETRDEPRDDLRREDDLRHEDDHAVAARERRRGRAQVHLGLAARRHSMKEEAAARAQRPGDLPDGDGLRSGRGEIPGTIFIRESKFGGHASHRARACQHHAAFCERACRGRRPARIREIA